MNKSELIKEVALKGQLSFNEATNAVDAIMETIAETMHKGESVTLVGFGSFEVKERAARIGKNPATGETIEIPAGKAPSFKAGKALKDTIK